MDSFSGSSTLYSTSAALQDAALHGFGPTLGLQSSVTWFLKDARRPCTASIGDSTAVSRTICDSMVHVALSALQAAGNDGKLLVADSAAQGGFLDRSLRLEAALRAQLLT